MSKRFLHKHSPLDLVLDPRRCTLLVSFHSQWMPHAPLTLNLSQVHHLKEPGPYVNPDANKHECDVALTARTHCVCILRTYQIITLIKKGRKGKIK